MSVEESRCLGLSWGRKCSILTIILSVIYLLVTLAYSLTMRLYLKGYYRSSHVAGLGAMVALFVLAHHMFRVRASLGCCSLQVSLLLFLTYLKTNIDKHFMAHLTYMDRGCVETF